MRGSGSRVFYNSQRKSLCISQEDHWAIIDLFWILIIFEETSEHDLT